MLTRTKQILAELVAFPSISADGNRAVTEHIAGLLADSGARVWTEPDATGAKLNLFATIGPEGPGGVVLSGHTDVVPVEGQPWATDPFAMVERDGRLYGRGTCDMKGFVAACIAMAPAFAARDLKVPVHFAFTYDEEIGCLGAQALTATLAARGIRPAAAIIGEPSMMQPVDGHKGCFEYTTRFTGLEGHGSSPDLGVNAVEYAAGMVARLSDLRAALKDRAPANSAFTPPHSTINIGLLSGGMAHNVIPGTARLEWEMRPVTRADADFVKSELAAWRSEALAQMQTVHPDAAIETETIAEVVGLTPDPDSAATRLAMDLTGANRAGLVPFGTEAGLFQQIGIPSVICGPGDITQAHKPDEFLSLGQLNACLALLDKLATRLERGAP
ncbi:MAG: acetylornithine deacetylase [Alphaproteobacteria bacterium]|nr:acetylornithine deacetylase [Alphaproteobacteria bacterium]